MATGRDQVRGLMGVGRGHISCKRLAEECLTEGYISFKAFLQKQVGWGGGGARQMTTERDEVRGLMGVGRGHISRKRLAEECLTEGYISFKAFLQKHVGWGGGGARQMTTERDEVRGLMGVGRGHISCKRLAEECLTEGYISFKAFLQKQVGWGGGGARQMATGRDQVRGLMGVGRGHISCKRLAEECLTEGYTSFKAFLQKQVGWGGGGARQMTTERDEVRGLMGVGRGHISCKRLAEECLTEGYISFKAFLQKQVGWGGGGARQMATGRDQVRGLMGVGRGHISCKRLAEECLTEGYISFKAFLQKQVGWGGGGARQMATGRDEVRGLMGVGRGHISRKRLAEECLTEGYISFKAFLQKQVGWGGGGVRQMTTERDEVRGLMGVGRGHISCKRLAEECLTEGYISFKAFLQKQVGWGGGGARQMTTERDEVRGLMGVGRGHISRKRLAEECLTEGYISFKAFLQKQLHSIKVSMFAS